MSALILRNAEASSYNDLDRPRRESFAQIQHTERSYMNALVAEAANTDKPEPNILRMSAKRHFHRYRHSSAQATARGHD